MNKVTASEAAKLVAISRQHLYREYINTGKISVTKENNKTLIDISELIRVFPNLKINDNVTPLDTNHDKIVTMLEKQLAEAKEREVDYKNQAEWYKSQIDELRHQTNRLIEDKTPKKRRKVFGIF
jgi:hypothetical protein